MPREIMGRKFYQVEEVAEIMGLLPRTIRIYINRGKISATKIGKRWQMTEEQLNNFLNGETVKPSQTLLNLIQDEPGAVESFYALKDRARILFNAWAELDEDKRAAIAAEILEFGGK
jgi:excisionase family DNA binding protein